MATSTTTTKKKKVVYKQDPDGVFRLKKLDTSNDIPSLSPQQYSSEKKKIDDYINELTDCSYKVLDDKPQNQNLTPPSQLGNDNNKRPSPTSTTTSTTTTTTSSGSNTPSLLSSPVIGASTISTFTSLPLNIMKNIQQSTNTEVLKFHPQSFILGAVIAILLYRSQSTLINYALIIGNIIKLGLIGGILVGGVSFYLGLIKLDDINKMIDTLKQKISGTSTTTLISSPPVEETHNTPSDDDSDDVHSMSSLTNESAPRPELKERRRSSIRVQPFRPISRQPLNDVTKYQSTPDLHKHQSSSFPPKLFRVNTDPKSLISGKRQTSPVRRSRGGSVESLPKRLPQPPSTHESEELPFINEVKLRDTLDDEDDLSSYNDDDYYYNNHGSNNVSPTHGNMPASILNEQDYNGIKRSMTTASKKSILGTRVNYNKFLANVHGRDED
ncbi:hypothetical protein DFJ63DRAFT_311597 [Scheffersomyces coipomensis]|uniref:uncharacterized protein n=1 Tax=Scheffersomyces coipomensis TaxID=1788519 RepID=UPI00315C4E0F